MPKAKPMNKVYELTIPTWEAVIPADWPLELETGEGFIPVAGKRLGIRQGAKLRGGPDGLFQGMLEQNFIREVED